MLLWPTFPLKLKQPALVPLQAIVDTGNLELRGEVAKSSRTYPLPELQLFRISERVRDFVHWISDGNAY